MEMCHIGDAQRHANKSPENGEYAVRYAQMHCNRRGRFEATISNAVWYRTYFQTYETQLYFSMLGCVACIFCCSTTCKAFWCITDFCIVQTPVDGYMFGTVDNRIDVTLAMTILVSSWLRRIRGFRTNDYYSNISRRISKLTYSHDHSTFHEKNRPESWEVCTEHIKMVEEIFDSQKQFQSFSRDVLISSEIEWESVR